MVLVIGGRFSGRHEYAAQLLAHHPHPRAYPDVHTVTAADADEFAAECVGADFAPADSAESETTTGEAHTGENPVDSADTARADAERLVLGADDAAGTGARVQFPALSHVVARLSSYSVVVATEMGCGVVPLAAAERAARERNGRLNQALAQAARAVVLMVAGVPRVIKGSESALAAALGTRQLALFRHGRTRSNAEKRFAGGVSDVPLSADGEAGVARAAARISAALTGFQEDVRRAVLNPAVVFVSPMARARRTAEILFPRAEQIPVAGLREMDMGLFEDMTHAELSAGRFADGSASAENAAAYQRWLDSGGTLPCPASAAFPGESMESFAGRTARAFEEILARTDAPVIVAVAHGGVQMALCAQFFEAGASAPPVAWQTDNADFRFGALAPCRAVTAAEFGE